MATGPLFFLACVSLALADYDCVCNYNVEEVVHNAPTDTAATLGYMYEFDCKEHIPVASLSSSWLAVAFGHHQGYVPANSALQIQRCQGSPPAEDRVTTTTSTTSTTVATTTSSTTSTPMSTTSTTTTSTTARPTTTTTTPKPTTTTLKSTTTPTIKTTTTTQTTTTTTKPTTTTTKPTTTTPKPTTTTTHPSTTTSKPATTTPQPTTTTHKPTTTTLRPTTHQPTTTTTKPTTTTSKPTTTTTKPTTTTPKPTTTTPRPTTTTHKPTTTTPKPTTTTPRPTTTTHKPTTTTHKPSTTHIPVTHAPITPKPTTHAPSVPVSGSPCYNTYRHYSNKIKGTLTSNGNICYEFVTSTVQWLDAENDCRTKGGHLTHIANAKEQTFINNFLKSHYNHRVWIGLHDRQTEEQFQWTSGSPVTYTHWSPNRYSLLHMLQDCVELDPVDNGFWKAKDCSTTFQKPYGYVCQYGGSGGSGVLFPVTHAPYTHAPYTHAPTTHAHTTHSLDGNTHICPSKNRQHSQKYGTILAQYGSSCYELMPKQKMTWQHGETLCQNGGGHLAHIRNAAEQTFIQGFMQRHMSDHAVWIGLHDLYREGIYQWSSGNSVSYRNFIPGHLSNYANRYTENCFVLIPYKGGKWDDIPCGSSTGLFDFGEVHPMICQFHTSTVSLIG